MNRCLCRRSDPCFAWLVAGALLVGLEACAGVTSLPPPPSGALERPLTSDEALATLRAREANLESVKGLFRADVRGARASFSGHIRGTLLYRRPQFIHIQGFTRWGGRVFDFLLRGQSYSLRVPEHRNAVVGHVADLSRLGDLRLPIQLSMRAVEMLLGKAPWASRSPAVRVEEDAYRYTVPLSVAGGRRHVWVDRYSAQIRAIEDRTPDEETRVALTASDFRRVPDGARGGADNLMLPFVVEIEDRAASGSVELAFLELAANVPLSERAVDRRSGAASLPPSDGAAR